MAPRKKKQQPQKEITLADITNNHVLFSSVFLKVLNKDKQIVPLHLNTVQKDVLRQMTSRTIILKGRQQGVSTLMQSLLFRLAVISTISGLVLSHEDRSTQAFRRMFTRFHEYMPDDYKPEFGYNNRTIISFPSTDSEIVVATAGGTGNVGRGFSFSHIHISEYAFINDPRPLLAGALQSGNPKVVIESTPNGVGNHFYELCMEAYEDAQNSVWKLLFYQWWKTPEYQIPLQDGEVLTLNTEEGVLVENHHITLPQIKWRRQKVMELGRRLFSQEYPETVESAFLASGVGYFADIPDFDNVFSAPQNVEYDETHEYIAGVDLGRNNDYTVLSIFDVTTKQEVELFRVNKLAWRSIIDHIIRKLYHWKVSNLWVEDNNVGGVIIEQFYDEIEQHPDLKTRINRFNTNVRTKPQLVNQMYTALDSGEVKLLPDPQGRKELYQFTAEQTISGNWKFSASSGHDDTVMARCIAWHGVLMSDIKLLSFF